MEVPVLVQSSVPLKTTAVLRICLDEVDRGNVLLQDEMKNLSMHTLNLGMSANQNKEMLYCLWYQPYVSGEFLNR